MDKDKVIQLKAELFDLQMQLTYIQNEIRLRVAKLNELLKNDKPDSKPVS